jgi:hypothetical protein
MVPNRFHLNVASTAGDPSLDLWMDGNWSNGFSTPPTQSVPQENGVCANGQRLTPKGPAAALAHLPGPCGRRAAGCRFRNKPPTEPARPIGYFCAIGGVAATIG